MSATTLSKLVKEINDVRVFANEDVNEGPIETLAGRRGRKHQAVETMKRLKREYTNELMRSAVFIIATGSNSKEFTDLATSEKFGLFSSDPEVFYNDLVGRVPESLYLGKESVSNLLDVLGRHLEDKANEMDIVSYPQLIFRQKYSGVIKSKDEFKDLVKAIINDQMGAEIVGIQAIRSITDQAIEAGHDGKITPIVLSTEDESLVMALNKDLTRLTNRVFLVVSGKSTKTVRSVEDLINIKEITEESVEGALNKIKSSLKK